MQHNYDFHKPFYRKQRISDQSFFLNGIQYTTTYLNFKPISISYPALLNLKYPMHISINIGITNDIMRHDCCSHGL